MAYNVNQYFPTPVLEYPNSTHFTPDKHTGVNLSTKLIIKLKQVSLYGATTKKCVLLGVIERRSWEKWTNKNLCSYLQPSPF